MDRSSLYVMAFFGATIVCVSAGILAFGFDFWFIRLVESFAELTGILEAGWVDSHLTWTVEVSALVTAPIAALIFFAAWRRIMKVESGLAECTSETPAN